MGRRLEEVAQQPDTDVGFETFDPEEHIYCEGARTGCAATDDTGAALVLEGE